MYRFTKSLLILIVLLAFQGQVQSQSIQSEIVPMYAKGHGGSANNDRIPVFYWAKVVGLTPNANYRYGLRAVRDAQDGVSSKGAGNQIFVRQNGGFGYSSKYGLANFTEYDSFTTNSNGEFAGWFGMEFTSNARFTDGNYIRFKMFLNDGNGGTVEDTFVITTDSVKCLDYSTTSASGSTAIYSHSQGTDKNFALLYDNTNGSGRPLSIAVIEQDGFAYRNNSFTTAFYKNNVDSISGAWGTIIPNDLSNGVRRVEQRKITDGSIVFANTDADGTWPTNTVNTVNPTGGSTPLVIDGTTDAPLKGSAKPVVSFAVTSQSQSENVASFTVNVNITNPDASNATSVDVVVSGGTATGSGTDYTYTTQTVTFPAGSSASQSVTVTINNDNSVEGDETIILQLQNATNSATIASGMDYDTLTILNDDQSANPVVMFSVSNQTVAENGTSVTVNVNIVNPNANATSVDVTVVGGTATGSGTDYNYSTQTVTFPASSSAAQSVTINITDDAAVEGNESIILKLDNATNSATYDVQYDTITITDNDGATVRPKVWFELDSSNVNEGSSATINVMIDTFTTADVTVDVEVSGGTAVNGTNYTYTKQTLTFPTGSKVSKSITVATTSDSKIDPKNILFSLSNISSNADLGSKTSHKLNIVDDGKNGINAVAAKYHVEMYPNPAIENIYISANDNIQQLELVDMNGKQVYIQKLNNDNYIMNITNVEAGLYVLKMTINGEIALTKVMVK